MKTSMPIVSLMAAALVAGCSTTGTRSDTSNASSMSGTSAASSSTNDRGMDASAGNMGTSTANAKPAMAGGDGLALAMLAGVNEHEIAASGRPVKEVSARCWRMPTDEKATREPGQTRSPPMARQLFRDDSQKASERAALARFRRRTDAYVASMLRPPRSAALIAASASRRILCARTAHLRTRVATWHHLHRRAVVRAK